MSLYEVTQICEIKFWNMVIPIMDKEGALMKIFRFIQKFLKSRVGYLLFLFTTFAAVGFLLGMVMGRVIWIVQIQ
jgi:hypothetical protein